MFQEIDNTGKGGLTANTLIGLYNSGLKNLRDKYQYSSKGGVAYLIDDDGIAKTGQDAINRWTEVRTQFQVDYTANSLMNRDGTFKNAMTEDIPYHLQFGTSIAEQAISSINERMNKTQENIGAGSKTPVVATPEPKNDSTSSVAQTSDLYKETRTDNKPDSNIESTAEDLAVFNSGMEIGTQGTVIKGRDAKEFGANYLQYVADNPKDYIEGLIKDYGNDYIVENINEYKIYLDGAANLIKDEERKEEYKRQVKETIDSLPKKITSIMRSQTAPTVLQMPENYIPIKAQKLLSDEGGFMGNYLYEDANGMQYISPELPSKFGIEVK